MLGRESDDFRLRKRFSSRKFLKPKSSKSPAESPAVAPGDFRYLQLSEPRGAYSVIPKA